MKTKLTLQTLALPALLFSTLISQPSTLLAQSTAFTYQGRLNAGGAPANGSYDLVFTILGSPSGLNDSFANQTNSATAVSNGLFTVTLDFGSGIFTGPERWLEIAVRTNGGVDFVTLSPRQRLTPTPYAIYATDAATAATATNAGSVPWTGLTGVPASFADNLDNNTTYSAGNGLLLLDTTFRLDLGLTDTRYWRLNGNSGTTPGTQFLGTTDDQALEIKVNGLRALRLEPNTEIAPNLVGGASVNYVAPGIVGATVGGGGTLNYLGLGNVESNSVFADFGTIGGGWSNIIRVTAVSATVGGGYGNAAAGPDATVGGGYGNEAGGSRATIAGGFNNRAGGDWGAVGGGGANTAGNTYAAVAGGSGNGVFGQYSAIAGGQGNTVDGQRSAIAGGEDNAIGLNHAAIGGGLQNTNVGNYSVIGGGRNNQIEAFADYSVIPGGRNNGVNADYAFAAGRRAQANHNGAFVWADNTDADFASTTSGEFAVRASGGARIIGSSTNGSLMVAPNETISGDDSQILLAEDHDGTFGMVLKYDGSLNQLQILGNNLGLSGPHLIIERDTGDVGIKRTPTGNDLEVEGTASKTAAGGWLANSDARIKQDIQPVRDAVQVLNRVRLVSFRYTDEYQRAHPSVEDRRYLNVVAQEFREVFPDHVKSSGETLADGSEILQVDTYPLTIYSAAAIQELDGQVKQLRREMKHRDAENSELKHRLEKLEQRLDLKAN